jgi:hypothetical protein
MIITALLLGTFFGLGVFIPRLRCRWAGTPIKCGAVGSLAASLIFLSWAFRRMYQDSLSEGARQTLFSISILGWVIAAGGYIIARRRMRRAGNLMQDLQRHMITRS